MDISNNIVYAIHNFEAENEDEINFLIGEPIMVLEKDEKYLDGWWQGRNISGQSGLFPMNYTSTEKPPNLNYDPVELFKAQPLMPHLSSRFSGSTVEDEIDNALSELQTLPASDLQNRPTSELHSRPVSEVQSFYNQPQNTSSSPLPTGSNIFDKPSTPVEQWDVDQVADWLHNVGLGSVSNNFIDQEITGDILLELDIEALKELGVNTFGKRYKIMQAIGSLKDEPPKEPNPTLLTPSHSVSRPVSRKSITSIRRSNSQDDSLYQFPRKAPLPPDHPTNSNRLDIIRPLSPQSLSSSGVSRSNTFNTMSSGGSRELSPDPKGGFKSPRRGLSQRSHQTYDSFEKDIPHFATTKNNDWIMFNDTNQSTDLHSTLNPVHPHSSLNLPSPSLSTSKQPMQISNTHKLTVSSFEERRSSTTEAFQAPEHEGWLHKQSDKYKTWNKRWFVLKGTNLFYFKSPKDVRMKGIINLRGYKIIVDETIHAGKYCFKAQHDRERTFYFYTDTEDSMRTWLKMLMKTTIARDFKAPVMSSNHIATVSLDVARKMRPRPPSVIMYKSQKTSKTNDPKMTMLEEQEEEQPAQLNFMQDYSQQARDPVYLSATPEEPPQLPPFQPIEHYREQEEEEDLIDPQHRSLPLSRSHSISSSVSGSGDEWSYVDWINIYLPPGKKVIDLASAFRNGDSLIQLLEGISGKEIRKPPVQKGGSMSVQMLDNIVAAFKFMGREGVEVDGQYTIKDVFGGNEIKIMAMLDAIKTWADKKYPIRQGDESTTKKSDTSVLVRKDSGWRGSAMMDNRYNLSDEGF